MKSESLKELDFIFCEYKKRVKQLRAEGMNFFPAINKVEKDLIPQFGEKKFYKAISHLFYYNDLGC